MRAMIEVLLTLESIDLHAELLSGHGEEPFAPVVKISQMVPLTMRLTRSI